MLREQDKHFLASLYAAVAIIFIWRGIWEGLYEIPYLGSMEGAPFIFLFVGFALLTFTGAIFKEFDPLGNIQKATVKVLHKVHHHADKQHFQIKYLDKTRKQHVSIEAKDIFKIEKGTLVIIHPQKNKEMFVPFSRITEILYKGKPYWRL